jgi:hypothetical protein
MNKVDYLMVATTTNKAKNCAMIKFTANSESNLEYVKEYKF